MITPYEVMWKIVPDIRHTHPFGCLAHALIPKDLCKATFESTTKECAFIGFSKFHDAFLLFNIKNQKELVCRDVHFFNSTFPLINNQNFDSPTDSFSSSSQKETNHEFIISPSSLRSFSKTPTKETSSNSSREDPHMRQKNPNMERTQEKPEEEPQNNPNKEGLQEELNQEFQNNPNKEEKLNQEFQNNPNKNRSVTFSPEIAEKEASQKIHTPTKMSKKPQKGTTFRKSYGPLDTPSTPPLDLYALLTMAEDTLDTDNTPSTLHDVLTGPEKRHWLKGATEEYEGLNQLDVFHLTTQEEELILKNKGLKIFSNHCVLK